MKSKTVKIQIQGQWFLGETRDSLDSTCYVIYFDRGWRSALVHGTKLLVVA